MAKYLPFTLLKSKSCFRSCIAAAAAATAATGDCRIVRSGTLDTEGPLEGLLLTVEEVVLLVGASPSPESRPDKLSRAPPLPSGPLLFSRSTVDAPSEVDTVMRGVAERLLAAAAAAAASSDWDTLMAGCCGGAAPFELLVVPTEEEHVEDDVGARCECSG